MANVISGKRKQERLAQQLRANLTKRKQQMRDRDAQRAKKQDGDHNQQS